MDVNVAPQQDLWLRAPLARSRLLETLGTVYKNLYIRVQGKTNKSKNSYWESIFILYYSIINDYFIFLPLFADRS